MTHNDYNIGFQWWLGAAVGHSPESLRVSHGISPSLLLSVRNSVDLNHFESSLWTQAFTQFEDYPVHLKVGSALRLSS